MFGRVRFDPRRPALAGQNEIEMDSRHAEIGGVLADARKPDARRARAISLNSVNRLLGALVFPKHGANTKSYL